MYESMVRAPRPPPRSFSSLGLHGYAPQPLGPNVAPVRAVSEHDLHPPTHRTIQPRPPRTTDSPVPSTTNGEPFRILRPFAPPELGVERRRKRGRPTKEEAEERDRLLRAAGQTYEPKRRPAKKPRPSETPGSASEALPGTSPGLQTPQLERAEPREETSSGKKRARRQREEEGSSQRAVPRSPLEDSGNERSTDAAAQSPSDRLLLRSNERSLAAAAVARDLQSVQSPLSEQEPGQKHDDARSGTPSV